MLKNAVSFECEALNTYKLEMSGIINQRERRIFSGAKTYPLEEINEPSRADRSARALRVP